MFVLTNYAQLLLYISYEQSELYMDVISKVFLVAITSLRLSLHNLKYNEPVNTLNRSISVENSLR